ncbi:hypothetical protein CYMTET_5175 [Cymbomonas tetramitiformis]|uniref:Pesticidal crystal protein Cry22Aa Ig-like domain-containing protein n=1 Tax=Cymbomonas tetramitiformis TaxID=36881 RepID=A0AAE0GZX7_9CHLO|nr:hypothetical protein CYMTET_5175 [Cymbomonas tetramitiformis]
MIWPIGLSRHSLTYGVIHNFAHYDLTHDLTHYYAYDLTHNFAHCYAYDLTHNLTHYYAYDLTLILAHYYANDLTHNLKREEGSMGAGTTHRTPRAGGRLTRGFVPSDGGESHQDPHPGEKHHLRRVARSEVVMARLASFNGLCQSVHLAVPTARLYLRELYFVLSTKRSWGAEARCIHSEANEWADMLPREINWVNPPWTLLDEVAKKIREEKVAATVVAPYWPGLSWFWELEQLADEVVIIPRRRDLFVPSRLGAADESAAAEPVPVGTRLQVYWELDDAWYPELGTSEHSELAVQMQQAALQPTTKGNYDPEANQQVIWDEVLTEGTYSPAQPVTAAQQAATAMTPKTSEELRLLRGCVYTVFAYIMFGRPDTGLAMQRKHISSTEDVLSVVLLKEKGRRHHQVAVLALCDWPSYSCEGLKGVCATCIPAENEGHNATCACLQNDVYPQTAPTVTEYIPPVDSVSPVMTLLGAGELGVTSSGVVIMLDIVQVDEVWEDAGVLATDDVDGDLSATVSSYGAGAVDTSEPTPADRPFVVTYTCQDAAGNAVEVRRWVTVVNPCAGAGEDGAEKQVCSTATDGSVTCSVGSLCTNLAIETEEEPAAPAEPPALQLVGPGAVAMAQGEVYAACPTEGRRLDLVCDQGATAIDPLDGDLTARVLACSPDGASARFVNVGVSVCGIDTHNPGMYNLTFSVSNSLGLTSTATRYVTVTAACPVGEVLCTNGIDCSTGGVCLGDLSENTEVMVEVDAPPSVALTMTRAVPAAVVEVKARPVE